TDRRTPRGPRRTALPAAGSGLLRRRTAAAALRRTLAGNTSRAAWRSRAQRAGPAFRRPYDAGRYRVAARLGQRPVRTAAGPMPATADPVRRTANRAAAALGGPQRFGPPRPSARGAAGSMRLAAVPEHSAH